MSLRQAGVGINRRDPRWAKWCQHNVSSLEGQETVVRPWHYFNTEWVMTGLGCSCGSWCLKWHKRDVTGDEEVEALQVLETVSEPSRHANYPEQGETRNGQEDCEARPEVFSELRQTVSIHMIVKKKQISSVAILKMQKFLSVTISHFWKLFSTILQSSATF